METVSTQVQDLETMDAPASGGKTYEPVCDARGGRVRGLWLRGDRFYAQIRVTTRANNRIPKKIALPENLTVPQAKKALEELKEKEARGELREVHSVPTLGDYISHYLERAKDFKSVKSLDNEKSFFLDWEAHFGSEMKIDRITEEGIRHFLDVQRREKSKRTKRHLTNHTLNLKIYALRSLLRMARDENKITRLPFNGIKKLKHKPARKELPPVGDIEQIAETALKCCPRSGQAFADYVHLLMYSGMREKEALNLQWAEIDFDGKRIHLHRGTKFSKERFVDFNPKLEGLLKTMLLRRNVASPWLFPSARPNDAGGRITSFSTTLKKVRQETGIYLSEHYLRHYFTSQAVMAGVDRFSLVKWLGHADGGKLIAEVYGHLSNEFQLKEASKLTNL